MCPSLAEFDPELVRRYDRNGPRYTSYPTTPQFRADFDAGAYRAAALLSNQESTPLSIYVHVPFCTSPCFYCGCNKVITRSKTEGQRYVDALQHEIDMHAALFDQSREVEQLHFGGGTPTFLSSQQLATILQTLERHFSLAPTRRRETSIEIDPRTVDPTAIAALARLGFNRISLGIQDFDPAVQVAVNRVQSVDDTRRIVDSARNSGIDAINFDLIYGLPRQNVVSFARTLDTVIEIRPSRISLYGYAHMPGTFKAQRHIDKHELPSATERLRLLQLSIEALRGAGYTHIGMDHFALPNDSLTKALAAGTMQRNFQGYSSQAECDLVGLGVSAIGKIGGAYAQNTKILRDYYAHVEHFQLAVQRGIRLSSDDRLRRDVIQRIMCQGSIDVAEIERDHCIDFASYFASEMAALVPLQADGLLEELGAHIRVSSKGRFLVRNIAMVFDAYLHTPTPQGYSKVV